VTSPSGSSPPPVPRANTGPGPAPAPTPTLLRRQFTGGDGDRSGMKEKEFKLAQPGDVIRFADGVEVGRDGNIIKAEVAAGETASRSIFDEQFQKFLDKAAMTPPQSPATSGQHFEKSVSQNSWGIVSEKSLHELPNVQPETLPQDEATEAVPLAAEEVYVKMPEETAQLQAPMDAQEDMTTAAASVALGAAPVTAAAVAEDEREADIAAPPTVKPVAAEVALGAESVAAASVLTSAATDPKIVTKPSSSAVFYSQNKKKPTPPAGPVVASGAKADGSQETVAPVVPITSGPAPRSTSSSDLKAVSVKKTVAAKPPRKKPVEGSRNSMKHKAAVDPAKRAIARETSAGSEAEPPELPHSASTPKPKTAPEKKAAHVRGAPAINEVDPPGRTKASTKPPKKMQSLRRAKTSERTDLEKDSEGVVHKKKTPKATAERISGTFSEKPDSMPIGISEESDVSEQSMTKSRTAVGLDSDSKKRTSTKKAKKIQPPESESTDFGGSVSRGIGSSDALHVFELEAEAVQAEAHDHAFEIDVSGIMIDETKLFDGAASRTVSTESKKKKKKHTKKNTEVEGIAPDPASDIEVDNTKRLVRVFSKDLAEDGKVVEQMQLVKMLHSKQSASKLKITDAFGLHLDTERGWLSFSTSPVGTRKLLDPDRNIFATFHCAVRHSLSQSEASLSAMEDQLPHVSSDSMASFFNTLGVQNDFIMRAFDLEQRIFLLLQAIQPQVNYDVSVEQRLPDVVVHYEKLRESNDFDDSDSLTSFFKVVTGFRRYHTTLSELINDVEVHASPLIAVMHSEENIVKILKHVISKSLDNEKDETVSLFVMWLLGGIQLLDKFDQGLLAKHSERLLSWSKCSVVKPQDDYSL